MKIAGWAFLAVALVSILVNPALGFDKDDLQYRFSDTLLWSINAKWNMYLYQEFNFGDNGGNFFCQVHEGGAVYSGLAKWLDLTVAYAKVYGKNNGEWLDENVPWIAATVKWDIKGWSISDKNRVEFDQKEKSEDDWHYRNFITVTLPVKFTRFGVQPYVADEIFYNFDQGFLSANEFRAGVNFKLIKNLSGGIYYLLRHSHTNMPDTNCWKRAGHVIATSVTASF